MGLGLLAATMSGASANTATSQVTPPPSSNGLQARLVPPRLSAKGVVYVPKAYYSSLVGVGLGGDLLKEFRLPTASPATNLSSIRAQGWVSSRKAIKAEVVSTLNWTHTSLKTKLAYDTAPVLFWGVGRSTPTVNLETYKPRSMLGYVELSRRVGRRVRVGVRSEYQRFELLRTDTGSLFQDSTIPGTEASQVAGAGVILDYDSRDRIHSPRSGTFFQAFALHFGESLGSDHDFLNYNLDLRQFFPLGEQHVLATQAFLYGVTDGAPFWRYAAIGGRAHSRGYRVGRYLDNVMASVQGEYRFPLFGRVGGVLFGGVADVAPTVGALGASSLKPTVGAGLRVGSSSPSGVKFRFDAALGEDETPRFYLSLDEAF